MAKKTAGMKIDISAETSQFKKDMKDVNSSLKSSASLGYELNKSLELDPTDIRKAEKALENFEDAAQSAEYKVELMNEQLKRMEEAEAPIDELKKMEKQISMATREMVRLQEAAQGAQKHIDKINSGEIEELARDAEKAAQGLKEVEQSAKGAAEETANFSDVTGELGGALDEATGGMSSLVAGVAEAVQQYGAWGAAILAATAALTKNIRATRTAEDVTLQYAASVGDTVIPTEELVDATTDFAKAVGIEVEEAVQLGIDALNMYGDEIQTAEDLVKGMTEALYLSMGGYIDSAQATAFLNTATGKFNLTTQQATNLLGDAQRMMGEYGQAAEDVIDVFIEWGDTFAMMGISADQFFDILEAGLILGANSTDEVANAFNEMYLTIVEGGDEVSQAFSDIGLDLETLQNQINNGMGSQAFVDILNALYAIEDQTLQASYAFAIFGSQGEEFISTLLADAEAMNALNSAMASNAKLTQAITTVVGDYSTTLVANADQLGLTAIEVENLTYKTQTYSWAALSATEKSILLANGFMVMAEQGKLNQYQMQSLAFMLQLTSGQATLTKENFSMLTVGMQTLYNVGLITTEQFNSFNSVLNAVTNSETLALQATNTFKEGLVGLLEQAGMTEKEIAEAAHQIEVLAGKELEANEATKIFDQALRIMTDSGSLTEEQAKSLSTSFGTLADEEATATERAIALQDMLGTLAEANLIVAEDAQKLIDKLQKLIDKFGGNTEAAKTDEQALEDLGKEMGTATDETEDFVEALKDSVDWLDQQRVAAQNARKELDKYETAAYNAGSASASIDSFATQVPEAMSLVPTKLQIPTIPNVANLTGVSQLGIQGNGSAHNTTNNKQNITFNIEVSVAAGADGKEIADDIVDQINKKLGRLML